MRKDQTMKRKRHTEEQIIAILKEHEAGVKTADLCRKHGISEASFYNWKAKYGGLEVSEAKRLKGLESERLVLSQGHLQFTLDQFNGAMSAAIAGGSERLLGKFGLFARRVSSAAPSR